MAGISADLINPFLMAATSIMKDICQTDMSIGKPYVKKTEFEDETVAIMIGITGEMKGQVLMAFSYANALNVASRMMMGMPVTELDSNHIFNKGNCDRYNTTDCMSGLYDDNTDICTEYMCSYTGRRWTFT